MFCVSVVVYSLAVTTSWCMNSLEYTTFPPQFKFGVATAAYQIEGAWNVSDKGESIWDRLLHTEPSASADASNGDVACDSYHLWQRDIEMLEELGVDMYRFSISWPRLLPSGFSNIISKDGKRYYNNLIDGLLAKGIEPVVTMYHFDLPQSLQDLGGWANPLIIDWYTDYARVLFSLFGDRVTTWLTFNEPISVCDGAYSKLWAPNLDDMKIGAYQCNKNVLIAHAKAYRIYDEEFRPLYNGKVSIANVFSWFEPEKPEDIEVTDLMFQMWVGKVSIANVFSWFEPEKPEDIEVTDLMFQMWEGRYAHPIYSKTGGWPPQIEKILNGNGKKEGYAYPRLPPFTEEEIKLC